MILTNKLHTQPQLTCRWVRTGNPRCPLAAVWTPANAGSQPRAEDPDSPKPATHGLPGWQALHRHAA